MSTEQMTIDIPGQIIINKTQLTKMMFIMNALDDKWSVKKRGDQYIFTKKHERKREVFQENYLETFIHSNMNFL